jgi:hypothetical protein
MPKQMPYKGSSLHVLDLVCSPSFESTMTSLLEGTGFRLATACCRRPYGRASETEWGEYKIEDYLQKHPIDRLPKGLDGTWWIPHKGNRPNWDLLCHISNGARQGLLIVEAKAHVGELAEDDKKGPPEAGNPRSEANDLQIRQRIAETSMALTALSIGDFKLSADSHYELANRLAYLTKLANEGVPTVLMYLGFLRSPDWPRDPLNDLAHWEGVVKTYVSAVAPWAFVGPTFDASNGGTMQMIVRGVNTSDLLQG